LCLSERRSHPLKKGAGPASLWRLGCVEMKLNDDRLKSR
jgi:hypothetical protein